MKRMTVALTIAPRPPAYAQPQQHQFRPDLPVDLAIPPTKGLLGGGPIIGGPEETVLLNCERVEVVSW